MERYVDRSDVLSGATKTVRDFKVPVGKAREIENFALPDQRARRRPGFKKVNDEYILDQKLTKVTPSNTGRLQFTSRRGRGELVKTPFSYALIRDLDGLRPDSTTNWSIEFMATLGEHEPLVVDPFDRQHTVGSGGSVRKPGVYLLDWAIMSNNHTFNDGTIASPGTSRVLVKDHSGVNQTWDAFPLSTLSVLYTKTHLKFSMDLVEKSGGTKGTYWPEEIGYDYAFPGGSYEPGDEYHIAITYAESTGVLTFYVNGVQEYTYTISDNGLYDFVGAYDNINGVEYASGLQRDIVLLNECTVRGSYASACKIQRLMHGHVHLFHEDSTALEDFNMPWCCSPPRGTAVRNLRFYGSARDASDILAEMNTVLTGNETVTPAANWVLNSGNGLNYDTINSRICSVHHGYPQYMTDTGLSNNLGVHFADGQYIALETATGQDIVNQVANTFAYDPFPRDSGENVETLYAHRRIQQRHDWTVQMQIRTPKLFQDELNGAETGGTLNTEQLTDATQAETRLSMSGSVALANCDLYSLKDGDAIDVSTPGFSKVALGDHAGDTTLGQFNRAYDSTLFSIEANSISLDGDNNGDHWYVPLVRGVLTPAGKVALEVSLTGEFPSDPTKAWSGGSEPRFIRVVSSTTLTADTVYDIQFVKRATDRQDLNTTPTGLQLEIWIGTPNSPATSADVTWKRVIQEVGFASHTVGNPHVVTLNSLPSWLSTGDTFQLNIGGVTGTAAASLNTDHVATVTGASTVSVPVNTTALTVTGNGIGVTETKLRTSPITHNRNFKIVFGATGIKDAWDRSVGMPVNTTLTSGGGPWQIGKVYMSPYQNQPGFYTLGRARVWTKSLADGDLQAIPDLPDMTDDHLIVHLDPTEVTGNQLPNRIKYSSILEMGYSAWGGGPGGAYRVIGTAPYAPEPVRLGAISLLPYGTTQPDPFFDFIPSALVPNTWSMSDCLGYTSIRKGDPTEYATEQNLEINGLLPFQTTLSKQYGLMSVAGDSMLIDDNLTGTYRDLYPSMLSEFSTSKRWRGVSVADRTIVVSQAGTPRSYDGKYFTSAGFKKYDGPAPMLRTGVVSGFTGSLNATEYIGVRLVYIAEDRAIQHVSEVAVVKVDSTGVVYLGNIHSHPDPRITSVVVYRTRAQASKLLARTASMFPTYEHELTNSWSGGITITDPDTNLALLPLALNLDPMPNCEFAAVVRDRVWLAGDMLIPDLVYFTDPGNPERIDTLNNRVVLEGGGDRITGLGVLGGLLVVFKNNSIWRVAENRGFIQAEKMADVGCVAEESIIPIRDPDKGTTYLFFWSQHGPYLFDGNALQYVGYDIEDRETPTSLSAEFTWLEPSSVLAMHDVRNREVICFYKRKRTTGQGTEHTNTRRTEAVVYNYRFGSWYRYTGFSVESALAQTFSGQENTGYGNPSFAAVEGELAANHVTVYNAYVGGTNGQVYEWGKDTVDGIPVGDSTDHYTVTSYDSATNVVTLVQDGGVTPSLTVSGYRHLSATIHNTQNGTYYTVPIVDNTGTTITLDTTQDPIEFDPAVNHRVYLGRPPARIEVPWDELGIEYYEKTINEIITWHEKEFFLKLARNWEPTKYSIEKKDLTAPVGQRAKTSLNANLAAAKLTLVSTDLEAAINGYGYTIQFEDKSIHL